MSTPGTDSAAYRLAADLLDKGSPFIGSPQTILRAEAKRLERDDALVTKVCQVIQSSRKALDNEITARTIINLIRDHDVVDAEVVDEPVSPRWLTLGAVPITTRVHDTAGRLFTHHYKHGWMHDGIRITQLHPDHNAYTPFTQAKETE